MATKTSASPARIEVIGRVFAAEAEYLRLTGWTPYVLGPGKIRWIPGDEQKTASAASAQVKEYTQELAMTLQRTIDLTLWTAP